MTKKNLIITIILLAVIDLLAAGWYMSRRIEASGKSQSLFDQRDSTEVIAMADTVTSASQADVFDKEQHNTYYFIANSPNIHGDETSYYTSIKHVKVRWPKKINGNDSPEELNKELIRKAFGNSQSQLKDARYMYLNTPSFNKPIGSDYHTLSKAPRIYPVYGNVSQVMVYPYMTGKINFVVPAFVHGPHGRQLWSSDTVVVSVPYQWVPTVIGNLGEMPLELPGHASKEAYYAEFGGILADLEKKMENP